MIRLSPHFYNNGGDVRIFFDALDGFGGKSNFTPLNIDEK